MSIDSNRTKRRLEGLVERGIFKSQSEAIDFAVDLLMKNQLEKESTIQASEYKKDEVKEELELTFKLTPTIPCKILKNKETGKFYAGVILGFDIHTQGYTIEETVENLEDLFDIYVMDKQPWDEGIDWEDLKVELNVKP